MPGRMLVVGGIAACVVAMVAAASHYGYAITERRLLQTELAAARERADSAATRWDDAETQLLRTKESLGDARFHIDSLSVELARVREQQMRDGMAFAQLTAMWEGESVEREMYKETLQSSSASLAGWGGHVFAYQLQSQIEVGFRKVYKNLERAAMDVLVSEEIMSARPTSREFAHYHERLSLLDTRGWAADRIAKNLSAFLRTNRASFLDPNARERDKSPDVMIVEKCSLLKDDAGMYRRAAQASADASCEASLQLSLEDGWVATNLDVREGDSIAMTVAGLFTLDRAPASSLINPWGAVRLRVRGSDAEYPGTVVLRPLSSGRVEIAVNKDALGRNTDKATVTLWKFRPLTGGR